MSSTPDISQVASLLAEPSRSIMLVSLMDGRPQTATELAQVAKITPQTASVHLAKLVAGQLIAREIQGKYHYFRLTDPNVAHAIESLIAIAPPSQIYSLRDATEQAALKVARTCYDHLAGKLGTTLAISLLERQYVACAGGDYMVTSAGRQFFIDFGIDIVKAARRRRKFAHPCMDWSERIPHIGGSLGAALLERVMELGWIEKKISHRSIRITEEGRVGFHKYFDVVVD